MTAPVCATSQRVDSSFANDITYRQRSHRRDVPALSTLSLYDEHTIPTRRRALLDRVARRHERVQARVRAQTELRHRHVVRDRRGEVDHRDLERGVALARALEDEQRVERLEAADEQERVEVVLLELRGDRAEVMALTQFSAQRTTTGQSTNAPGLLRLDMQRVDGRWKLAELTPLTANR